MQGSRERSLSLSLPQATHSHRHGSFSSITNDALENVPTAPMPPLPAGAEDEADLDDPNVEPKIAFANERTFLAWVHFTVLLGAIAVGMLNFDTKGGIVSAAMFSILAIAILIYALCVHLHRSALLRRREQEYLPDRIGPTVLALVALAAVIVNFVLLRYD